MELNLSVGRLSFLIALILAFSVSGGFSTPEVASESYTMMPRRLSKAWTYCILLFLGGAVSVSVIDHTVGTMDRSSIRFLYVIFGVILMTSSIAWQRGLREAAASTSQGNPVAPTQMMDGIKP